MLKRIKSWTGTVGAQSFYVTTWVSKPDKPKRKRKSQKHIQASVMMERILARRVGKAAAKRLIAKAQKELRKSSRQ